MQTRRLRRAIEISRLRSPVYGASRCSASATSSRVVMRSNRSAILFFPNCVCQTKAPKKGGIEWRSHLNLVRIKEIRSTQDIPVIV